MAQLTTGTGFPLRFDDLDLSILLQGSIATSSDTSFIVSFPDGYREIFTGTGFNPRVEPDQIESGDSV